MQSKVLPVAADLQVWNLRRAPEEKVLFYEGIFRLNHT
jgi:hypothetical protein